MFPAFKAPPLRQLLFIAMPILCGAVALLLGMDASWDLRNYHYYNGWALLHGQIHRDLLVAQIPSFYNPLLDLPFAALAGWLDARLLAFALGSLHGLNFIALTLIGESLLSAWQPASRLRWSALLAATGCAGAVALSEIGTVFYDNVTSLGLFGSLLLLLRHWQRLGEGKIAVALLAGLPLGIAFGLKLTMVPYPIGLCLALLLVGPGSRFQRARIAFFFGCGVTLGCLSSGGFWMVHLASAYGNPIFPYFNALFHSPWALAGDNRDIAFEPKSWLVRIFFPVFFTFDSRLAAEVDFTDLRLLLLFLFLPIAALFGLIRERKTALLCLAIAIAYLVWLKLFAIYRYLVAVEMLAPLMLALLTRRLSERRRGLAIALLVLLLVATTRPAQWIRVPFTPRAVMVQLPAIEDPDHSLVLLAGHEPLSFLIPSFPQSMRFLRIDSTFTNPDQTEVRFNPLMRQIIDGHDGKLLALFIPIERHDVIKRLGNLDLALDPDQCAPVIANIGAAPYQLCTVVRR